MKAKLDRHVRAVYVCRDEGFYCVKGLLCGSVGGK